MNILVLNCGSSSLKFQIIATDDNAIANNSDEELAKGLIEKIGSDEAIISLKSSIVDKSSSNTNQYVSVQPLADHIEALNCLIE